MNPSAGAELRARGARAAVKGKIISSFFALAAMAFGPLMAVALDPLGEPWLQSAKLKSDPPVAGASLGSALAASGGRVLVGAPGEGKAFVFEPMSDAWVQTALLTVPGLPSEAAFGETVALHGDAAFVGAPGVSSVYVFRRGDTDWTLTQTLSSGSAQDGTRFGASLATDGKRLAVGARTQAAPGPRAGAVHVFVGVGDTLLMPEQVLTADLGASAQLGWAVAINGPHLAAGAGGARAVATFERRVDAWEWTGTVTSSTPNDAFARAVAIGGDVLAVGASFEVADGVRSGAVHVYYRTAGGWEHVAHLLPRDLAPFKYRPGLGTSLALAPDGQVLVVGAPGDDKTPSLPSAVPSQTDPVCMALGDSPTCYGPGAAYVFTRGAQGWHQQAKLTMVDALPYEVRRVGRASALGSAVAFDQAAGLVVAGAPHADFLPGDEAGAAYVFARRDAGAGS